MDHFFNRALIKIVPTVLWLYSALSTYGSDIDSLLKVLEQDSLTRKQEIKTLRHLAWQYGRTDLDKSIILYQKITDYALEDGDTILLIKTLNNLGLAYNGKQDYLHAKKYLEQGLNYSECISYVPGISRGLSNLGIIYRKLGDYQHAFTHTQRSYFLKRELDDSSGMAKTLLGLSILSKKQKNLSSALDYLKKAQLLFEKVGNLSGMASTFIEISTLQYHQDNSYMALESGKKALALYQQLHLPKKQAYAHMAIGNAYSQKQDYKKALIHYRCCQQQLEKLGDRPPSIRNSIANTYLKMKDYDSALLYCTIDSTLTYTITNLEARYDNLRHIYEGQELLDSALKYNKLYQSIKDSIFNIERAEQIEQMKTRFDLNLKEEQIALQQGKIELMKTKESAVKKMYIALMVIVLLLVLVSFFIYYQYRLKKSNADILRYKNDEIALKNEQIAKANLELEKRMLRAQMDPHFIFNSLNSIQHLIAMDDKYAALKYLSTFSKLMRQTLENSISISVPIADEIQLLECYLTLEGLRFNRCFDYQIDIDDTVDIYNTEIPFLLIQPYVENAIVHGLMPKKKDSKLEVSLSSYDRKLHCSIKDNGIGRSAAREIKNKRKRGHCSRGMSVTQRRLALLNKDPAHQTFIKITDLFDERDNAAGTMVKISIPML